MESERQVKFLDVISYVNSKDIRQYLHDINYQCNTIQAAWLVYQSAKMSMVEKYEAYRWIIDNMPDLPMPKVKHLIKHDSIHEYLNQNIEFFEKHKAKYEDKGGIDYHITDEEDFDYLWCYFPTPFKKGDIVCSCLNNPHNHFDLCTGMFVLDEINNTAEDYKRYMYCGKYIDMNAYGWFQDLDGAIYYESMSNYMNLERYTGELYGQERILIAVSNFVQDKIGFELLLQSQRTMMMRDYGENWMPKIYTDAGMKLAGLTNLPKLTKAQKKANNLRRKKISRYITY